MSSSQNWDTLLQAEWPTTNEMNCSICIVLSRRMLFCFQIAGALAEKGCSLEEVVKVVKNATTRMGQHHNQFLIRCCSIESWESIDGIQLHVQTCQKSNVLLLCECRNVSLQKKILRKMEKHGKAIVAMKHYKLLPAQFVFYQQSRYCWAASERR